MATNAIAGYRALLKASTAEGQTPATIAELRDYNIDVQHAEIDVTNHDSSGSREIIAGIDQWSGGGEVNYVTSTDTSNHGVLFDLLVGKTRVDFEFLPTGSSSEGYFSGTGYVSGFNMSAPTEEALSASLTFVGNGAFARSASSST